MIEVQLIDIVDTLLNIPNAIYTFYFHTKVCNVKNKKAYIIILTLYMSFLTFLQNTEIIGHEMHVVLAFLGAVFAVQLFIREKRMAALWYTFFLYLALILGEAVFYVIGFAIYHVQLILMVEDIMLMTFWKICFSIFAFCIEYVVTSIWLAKVRRINNSFNTNIFFIAVVELFIVWSTLWITLDERENSNAALVCLISAMGMVIFNIIQLMAVNQDLRKQKELVRAEILKNQLDNQNSRRKELKKELEKADETKRYILENVGRAEVLLEERQGENAREQLQGIVDTIAVKYMYSNNKIADALLSQKAKICDEYGIQLSCRLDFPDNMPVDNARLCIVLSNLLDNAIRACRELKPDTGKEYKPFISLKVNEQFGYLVIRQENSFNGIVENRRSGAFSEHGLGMEIIKNIADELKGELVTEHDDKVFVTSVGVPLM